MRLDYHDFATGQSVFDDTAMTDRGRSAFFQRADIRLRGFNHGILASPVFQE
jgi:hypothetical protein